MCNNCRHVIRYINTKQRNHMKVMKVIFAICCALIISACGGGGDSSSAPSVDFSGTWSTNIAGIAVEWQIVQTDSKLNIKQITPSLPDSQKTVGVVIGNSASMTDYINDVQSATRTLTLTNSNTMSSTLNTCTPPAGYRCLLPVGSAVILTR